MFINEYSIKYSDIENKELMIIYSYYLLKCLFLLLTRKIKDNDIEKERLRIQEI